MWNRSQVNTTEHLSWHVNIGSGWLGAPTRPRWPTVDPDLCCHMASLGHSELNHYKSTQLPQVIKHHLHSLVNQEAPIQSKDHNFLEKNFHFAWWSHDQEMLSTWLALCEGNPMFISGFSSQWPTGLGSIPFFRFNSNSNSVIFNSNSNSNSTTHKKFQFQFQFQRFQFQFQFRRFQIPAISILEMTFGAFFAIDYNYTNKVHVYKIIVINTISLISLVKWL